MSTSTRLVTVDDGTRINVCDVGSGAPVLLLHGWGLGHEVWDRQISVLLDQGFRVLATDHRGHGGSDAPYGDYTIERLAADVAAVIDDIELEHVAVVGWSLGGLAALRLAHDRPALVERIVLVASHGVAGARHDAFPFGTPGAAVEDALRAADRRSRVEHRRRTLAGQFGSPPAPEVLDWLLGISLRLPSWAAAAAMHTLLHTEQTNLMNGLGVPVTQILGRHDPVLDVEGGRWLHREHGTTLVELDCGHYPMLECASDFDDALVKALMA